MSNKLYSREKLSVYEKQQLLRYHLSEENFLNNGAMPVEYFTGKVDFADLTLKVNDKVLIPRVETEELVEQAFKLLKNNNKQELLVLDLGTGSGAIALSLIKQLRSYHYLNKNWQFYLIDSSPEAIKLAKENYQELLVDSIDKDRLKVNFLLSNLLENVNKDLQFDLVLANLPYIPSGEIKNLASSVKDFEPKLALDGGKTGFELIAKALKELLEGNLISKHSNLLFETDHSHNQIFLKKHYPELLELFTINFIKDQFSRQRFLQLKIKAQA